MHMNQKTQVLHQPSYQMSEPLKDGCFLCHDGPPAPRCRGSCSRFFHPLCAAPISQNFAGQPMEKCNGCGLPLILQCIVNYRLSQPQATAYLTNSGARRPDAPPGLLTPPQARAGDQAQPSVSATGSATATRWILWSTTTVE